MLLEQRVAEALSRCRRRAAVARGGERLPQLLVAENEKDGRRRRDRFDFQRRIDPLAQLLLRGEFLEGFGPALKAAVAPAPEKSISRQLVDGSNATALQTQLRPPLKFKPSRLNLNRLCSSVCASSILRSAYVSARSRSQQWLSPHSKLN